MKKKDLKLEVALIAVIMGDNIAKELYKAHNEGYIFTIDTIAHWAIEWEKQHRNTDWEDFNDNPAKYGYPEKEVACWDDAVIFDARKKLNQFKADNPLVQAPPPPPPPRFEVQQTPESVWVVAFDTVCDGWQAIYTVGEDENNPYITLFTEAEADHEVAEDPETLFKVHMNDYIHGRKTIINADTTGKVTGIITGVKPIITKKENE